MKLGLSSHGAGDSDELICATTGIDNSYGQPNGVASGVVLLTARRIRQLGVAHVNAANCAVGAVDRSHLRVRLGNLARAASGEQHSGTEAGRYQAHTRDQFLACVTHAESVTMREKSR